jgi:D-alanine-D-alanine ligase
MMRKLRVGVIFGGRSSEHEVSLASAASVIAALGTAGHATVPIGITRQGQWLVGGDPLAALATEARIGLPVDDPSGSVKKALVGRAETGGVSSGGLARLEAAGGLPAGLGRDLDVVVIMLHGPYGEDGTIQGLLELAGLPYVGAGVMASAVGMDKAAMKDVFRAHGLPVVEHTVVRRRDWETQPDAVAGRIAGAPGFPCFVKPSNLGSSVGISKVRTPADLAPAMREAARYDRKILVERAVSGREIEVSVLGNDDPLASLPGEVQYASEWYDYETKYAEGQVTLTIPAPVSLQLTRRLQELALGAFAAIDCAGMARVDFFLEGDQVLVNEINTIPGFTATSAYARLWEASGIPYAELVSRLLELALERHRQRGPS